jgi:hypothetical protein
MLLEILSGEKIVSRALVCNCLMSCVCIKWNFLCFVLEGETSQRKNENSYDGKCWKSFEISQSAKGIVHWCLDSCHVKDYQKNSEP